MPSCTAIRDLCYPPAGGMSILIYPRTRLLVILDPQSERIVRIACKIEQREKRADRLRVY